MKFKKIPTLQRLRHWSKNILIGIFALGCYQLSAQDILYASPTGSDDVDNQGTLEAPASLNRAKFLAKKRIANGLSQVKVYLLGGRYQLTETINFTNLDSGTSYLSFPGHKPVISGGSILSGWEYFERGIYRIPIPIMTGTLQNNFRQIYIGGTRATRARTPNVKKELPLYFTGGTPGLEIDTALLPSSVTPGQIEIVSHCNFSTTINRISQVVPESPEEGLPSYAAIVEADWVNFCNISTPTLWNVYLRQGQPYHLENDLSFLDEPGEWFANNNDNMLYYMPRPWEINNGIFNSQVVIPQVESLINFNNNAKNITISGITFEHSNWTQPTENGYVGSQAHELYPAPGALAEVPPAINITYASDIILERNLFQHFGASAIGIRRDTHYIKIIGNTIDDCAGGGLVVHDPVALAGPSDIQINNNLISNIGRDYYGCVGIFVGWTKNVTISNNELRNMPYTGISMGWSPGANKDTDFGQLFGQRTYNCLVNNNDIHDVMQELCDGGGIYTLQDLSSSVIENNYIHNIYPGTYAGTYPIAKLYIDNGSRDLNVRLNFGGPDVGDVGNNINIHSEMLSTLGGCSIWSTPWNMTYVYYVAKKQWKGYYLSNSIPAEVGITASYKEQLPTNIGLSIGSAWGYSAAGILGSSFNLPKGQSPVGYSINQFIGSANIDYPAFIALRPASATTPILDFGGMYGYVNGAPTVNPVTNTIGCPPGFTPVQILGSYGKDYPLFICLRLHSDLPGSVKFGGIWGFSPGLSWFPGVASLYRNPATGGAFSPDGFNKAQVLGTANVDYPVWFAWKP